MLGEFYQSHHFVRKTQHVKPCVGLRAYALAAGFVVIFGSFPTCATTNGCYTFDVSNRHVTITKFDASFIGALSVANTFEGCPVTGIGDWAFSDCTNLTSVTIPDSVTDIGEKAFSLCGRLTSVTVGNGVTNIGDYAFNACTSLTSVAFGSAVTRIGNSVLQNCNALANVTIPNSVTQIGDSAFNNCTNLTSVALPDSVTRIGNRAFFNCACLTSAKTGDGVTRIGDYAFFNCTSLTNVEIGIRVTSIGNNAFLYCRNLTGITIPDSVTGIGNSAFRSCDRLSSATIPSGVTNIGDRAFSCCDSLNGVYFKGFPPKTGENIFESPHISHMTVYYPDGTPGWEAKFADRPTAPWILLGTTKTSTNRCELAGRLTATHRTCHRWSPWWLILLISIPGVLLWLFRRPIQRRRRACRLPP